MENSAKNDWGKGRLVPVALVFLGLICASWLSIGSEAETNVSESTKHNVLAADTSREDGLKVIRSKKGRIHYEDPTDPVEDIPEIEFVPDESFDAPSPSDLDVVIPEMAEIPWQDLTGAMKALDAVPPMKIDGFTFPKIPTDAFNFDEMWQGDSIPGFKYYGEAEEWEQFEKEFTKKFKEQFKEFYGKNQEEFDKMMEEMKKERREAAEVVDLDQLRRGTYIMDADKLNLLRDQLTQLDNQVNHLYVNPGPQGFQSPQIYVPDHEGLARMDDALEQLEALKEMQFDEQFRRRTDEELSLMNERLREQGHFLEEVARNAESYKKELTNLLRQDGYIDSNESIGGVNISIDDDNGNMTINGKPIKQKDQVKYRALHDKYFAPTYKREGRRSE